MRDIVVGSRNSKLALIQTKWVIEALREKGVKESFSIKEIMTKGDKNLHVSLTKLGQGGVFLQEIETQLLHGEIDFAVHSLKDVPVTVPKGLTIASIPKREDHRDAYIAKHHIPFEKLPSGAVIGTSSIRRQAQILAKRPDLEARWIRGPIDQRIKQLEEGSFDAIILAVAGLKRLGIDLKHITEYLPENDFMPAMGQGALAIECREDDEQTMELLSLIHDVDTANSVYAERLFLEAFAEGDQAPLAAYANVKDGKVHLRGRLFSLNGKTMLEHEAIGTNPDEVAKDVATALKQQGADALIQRTNAELKHIE